MPTCPKTGRRGPADWLALLERYPFLEFGLRPSGLAAELSEIRRHGSGHYWLELGQGWWFFAPERLLTRLISVLDAEPEILQVGVNMEDAHALTGRCTAERDVCRTADGGRYTLSTALFTGPAMVHVARVVAAGGQTCSAEPASHPPGVAVAKSRSPQPKLNLARGRLTPGCRDCRW